MGKVHSRRNFLKGTLLGGATLMAFGITGCSGEGSSGAKQEVAIGHLNSTAHLLAFVAKEEGFFDEEGINATLTQFASQSELVSGLESNKLQVVFLGSVPTLVNQASGHDISIFGGAMTNGHGYVIKSKYTEGLEKWDATILKGRTVAVPRTTIQELELFEICKKYGMTYGESGNVDVKIVYFDSQKDAYNALSNETIDAVSTYSPYTSIAVAAGHSIVYSCYEEDIFENQPCCRQVALTSALEENPELYHSFERAIIKAYAFYKNEDNKEKTIADIKKYIDIENDQIEYEVFTPNYCDSNPDPDKQATVKLKEEAVDFGYIEDFDLESKYDTSIYERALATLVEEDSSNSYYQSLQEHFAKYE